MTEDPAKEEYDMKKTMMKLMLVLLVLPLSIRTVKADMGPKPAINLEFEEKYGPEYYCVLLSNLEGAGPNGPLRGSDDYGTGPLPEKLLEVLLNYSDSDGCRAWNLIYHFNDTSSVSWGYFAPSVFKIAIYREDGTLVAISELIEKETFKGYFRCSVKGSVLTLTDDYDYKTEILKLTGRMALTIALELVIGLLFGYRSRKEIITIILVNVVTQFLLNGYISFDTIYGGGFSSFIIMFPAELVILIAEILIYCFLLKGKKGKIIAYGALANILSFLLTFTSLAL